MKHFERLRARFALALRFRSEFDGQRGSIALVLALSLSVALCQVVMPWPIQRIFDQALVEGQLSDAQRWAVVWKAALALLSLTLLQAGAEYLSQVRIAKVGQHLSRRLRLRLFSHLTQLSPRFFARHKSGDLLVRLLGDVSMARGALVDASLELVTRTLWVTGVVVVMAWLDLALTAVLLLVLPAVVWVSRVWSRRIETQARKQRRKEGALADFLQETLAANELLQTLGVGAAFTRRLARESRTAERAGQKSARLAARLGGSVHALLGAGVALTLVLGSWRVLRSELTPGELLVFVSYVRGVLKPVRSASRNSERIAKGVACAQRIAEVLDEPIEVREAPDALPAPLAPRQLEFRDVHFSHDGERDALRGLDACFKRGELSGVFGASGAGKSTLAALAVRLHDPERGAVLIDGQDLRRLELDSVRARVGLSLQQAHLLGANVRESLLLGREEPDEARLWSALAAAGAAAFVKALPQGLDTPLGAGGVGLSGGQQRRIALARTLLRRTPILVVDEPFAGLDQRAASAVLAHLRVLAQRSIVIVIAHERELLEHYDHLVFVDDGRAVACGRHADLLASSARYRAVVGAECAQVTGVDFGAEARP